MSLTPALFVYILLLNKIPPFRNFSVLIRGGGFYLARTFILKSKEAASKPWGYQGGVHTFVNKKGLWCRMNVIQNAFYSPNLGEHFKNLLYGDSMLRKFFSAVRSSETPSKSHFSSLFTAFSLLKSSFQRSSKYKNLSVLTFASIKNDWCVM